MSIPTQSPLRGHGTLDARSTVPTQPGPGFRALVVDDHPLMRESMVTRLKAMGAMEVTEAASIAEAQARARSGPMDLAVLDLGLPDGNGLDLLAYLRSQGWPRLVVLSAADDPYSVRAAFVAGAHGYLLKNASPVVVADGVRRVLSGGVYADPSVAPLLASGLRGTGTSEGLPPSSPVARSRCCGWWPTASRTRRSVTCSGSPLSRSRATWPASPASSGPATVPRWSRSPCAPASSAELRVGPRPAASPNTDSDGRPAAARRGPRPLVRRILTPRDLRRVRCGPFSGRPAAHSTGSTRIPDRRGRHPRGGKRR